MIIGSLINHTFGLSGLFCRVHLKSYLKLFHLVQFVKCWQFFLELNFKGLYQCSGKEKESHGFLFMSSTKHETRHFHTCRSAMMAKKCPKKAWCTCKVVVLPVSTYCFFDVLIDVAVIIAQVYFLSPKICGKQTLVVGKRCTCRNRLNALTLKLRRDEEWRVINS